MFTGSRSALVLALSGSLALAAQTPAPAAAPAVTNGTLPDRWTVSGPTCGPDPKFQVHQYEPNFYILRESGCSNYEKPFVFLLFGKDKALLLDTGAGKTDVGAVVQSVVDAWCKANGRDAIPLVVAHTHAHGDHIAGDAQFKDRPGVTLVGTGQPAVAAFFGVKNWPEDIVQFDLGERVLDVIPIPGHQASSIAVYDRRTGILFTGDSLYPGRLYVSDGAAFVKSVQRLVDFTAGKPVSHVLGNHIEQTRTPFVDYPIRTVYQPDEHALELGRAHLLELNDALQRMNGTVTRLALRDFTIWPQ